MTNTQEQSSNVNTKPTKGLKGLVTGLVVAGTLAALVGGTFLAREVHVRNDEAKYHIRQISTEDIHQEKDGRFYNIYGYEKIDTKNQGWVSVERKDNILYWGSDKIIKTKDGYFCVEPTPTKEGKFLIHGHIDDFVEEVK